MKNNLLNPIYNLVQDLPDSKLTDFTKELVYLWWKYPEIQISITQDRDTYAKEKKLMRLKDKQYELSKIPSLTGLEKSLLIPESTDELILETGAPRMPGFLVFLFMQLRGYWGSISDSQAQCNLFDSMTINIILQNIGVKMPGRSTIVENINVVSNETRELIFKCQLADVFNMNLDDFKEMLIDSTSVEANNRWPTDAGVIVRLAERVVRNFKALEHFGIDGIPDFYLPTWLGKMHKAHFNINNTSGFKGAPKEREKHYKILFGEATKAVNFLTQHFQRRKVHADNLDLKPSQKQLAQGITTAIENDLADLVYVIEYSRERIFEGKQRPSSEKILSLSDKAAAFIKKGDRQHVIGYKPQLSRSANGFVTALLVESGNASDSKSLFPAVKKHITNTTIIPSIVSTDDGYSSQEGFDKVKSLEVERISLSGAKGKRILGEELWTQEEYIDARRNRSAVESLMFTLKYSYKFGRMRRRGMNSVKAEMLEKVTAYNIARSALMKRKLEEEKCLITLPEAG